MDIFLLSFSILSSFAAFGMYLFHRFRLKQSESCIHTLQSDLTTAKLALQTLSQSAAGRQKEADFEQYAVQIVSGLNQGVIYIDQNRIIRFINPYAERFLNENPALGKPYQDVIHIELDKKRDYSLFESAFGGKTQMLPDTAEMVTNRGNIPISGSVISDSTGNHTGTVVFIFADNSAFVQQINEEKTFFSQAAHELRTPLTVIRLTVGVLLKQFDTLGREKIMEHLHRADITAEHLVKLVNDFLNMSRLELGRIEITNKPFDMQALTEEIIAELTPLAREHNLYIHHEAIENEYRTVIGDRTKSKEVLTNLITNGIKYTILGGLTVTHKADGNMLNTTVTDTGSGIPADQQSLLFKRFMQVGGARLQPTAKSTGLGLYISRKFAELMHGDVRLDFSEPGKGSAFTFTLPLG